VSSLNISVIIPTYNRCALLEQTLRSVLTQDAPGIRFEVVVVDNNSTDETASVVAKLQPSSPVPIRLLREPRQGNAYARNTGIEQARGRIIAFLDDDVRADRNWIATMKSALDRDPGSSFVGGPCLPRWAAEPPSCRPRSHWAPLAMLAHAPDAFDIARPTPGGLLTANVAIRRSVFDELGGFLPELQRAHGSIGSMEDHEFLSRMCRSGKRGWYTPELVTRGYLHPERATKAYHRRWHAGHGHFYAVHSDRGWEPTKWAPFGVPLHVYRRTLVVSLRWCGHMLAGLPDAAFTDECELHFFRGFFRERRRQWRTSEASAGFAQ
jgi:glycosyltransferase involved in cell wall biosynthesis